MTAYTYPLLVVDLIDNMEEDSAEFRAALPNIIGRASGATRCAVTPDSTSHTSKRLKEG